VRGVCACGCKPGFCKLYNLIGARILTQVGRKEGVTLYKKSRFLAYLIREERMSLDGAKRRWKKDKKDPNIYKETRNGEVLIAIEDRS